MSPHPAGGETEEEMQRVDVLENQIMDLRMSFVRLCYNPDFVSTPPRRGGHRVTDPPHPSTSPPRNSCPQPRWGHGDKGTRALGGALGCTPRLPAGKG